MESGTQDLSAREADIIQHPVVEPPGVVGPGALQRLARGPRRAAGQTGQGAFVLGMAFKDRELMKRQSQQFRQYLDLLFRPRAAA
ncbi:MAG: hypothetical protein IT562_15020 [Alphaproteobacteria bacterium]|nr:hypothetical protein [Alphaproteobacteria bacterium]